MNLNINFGNQGVHGMRGHHGMHRGGMHGGGPMMRMMHMMMQMMSRMMGMQGGMHGGGQCCCHGGNPHFGNPHQGAGININLGASIGGFLGR